MTPLLDTLHAARKLIATACVLAWAGAFTVTHIPEETASQLPGSDPSLHFIGYFAITGILWLTLLAHRITCLRRITWVLVGSIAYSTLDELTQPLFGRSCAMSDWLSNLTAICTVLILTELFTLLASRKKNAEAR